MGQTLYFEQEDGGIAFRTERKIGDVRIPNYVYDIWMPIIGSDAIGVYGVYCRLEMNGSVKKISRKTLASACRIGTAKLERIDLTLQECGFIKIEKPLGQERLMHYTTEIVVCDPPKEVSAEIIKDYAPDYDVLTPWLVAEISPETPNGDADDTKQGCVVTPNGDADDTKQGCVVTPNGDANIASLGMQPLIELGAQISNGANAPSDESLVSDDTSSASLHDSPDSFIIETIDLIDESYPEENCPRCGNSIVLKNLKTSSAVCPHCNIGLYIKNADGVITHKPPQFMREKRKRNRLIDLFPCPEEWQDFPYYARDKTAFNLLYDTAKDDLMSALSWSVGQYTKGQMAYKEIVAAAIKATQKRLSLKSSQSVMSISDKAETSIERMARENGLTVEQVMEQLKVGGYVQS